MTATVAGRTILVLIYFISFTAVF